MRPYHFPGFPAFLDAAAAEIGRPQAAGPARRIEALAALANLCAQASNAPAADVAAILRKADEFRDQLLVAHRAAELILIDVRNALVPTEILRPIETSPRRTRLPRP